LSINERRVRVLKGVVLVLRRLCANGRGAAGAHTFIMLLLSPCVFPSDMRINNLCGSIGKKSVGLIGLKEDVFIDITLTVPVHSQISTSGLRQVISFDPGFSEPIKSLLSNVKAAHLLIIHYIQDCLRKLEYCDKVLYFL